MPKLSQQIAPPRLCRPPHRAIRPSAARAPSSRHVDRRMTCVAAACGRRALLDHHGKPVGRHAAAPACHRAVARRSVPPVTVPPRAVASSTARPCPGARRAADQRTTPSRRPARGRCDRRHGGRDVSTGSDFGSRIDTRYAIRSGVGKVTRCERRAASCSRHRLLIELDDQAVLAHAQCHEECRARPAGLRGGSDRRLPRRMTRIGHRNQNRRHLGHDRRSSRTLMMPGASGPVPATRSTLPASRDSHRLERGRPVRRFERAQARVEREQVEPARAWPARSRWPARDPETGRRPSTVRTSRRTPRPRQGRTAPEPAATPGSRAVISRSKSSANSPRGDRASRAVVRDPLR